jgi:hypothetical protein
MTTDRNAELRQMMKEALERRARSGPPLVPAQIAVILLISSYGGCVALHYAARPASLRQYVSLFIAGCFALLAEGAVEWIQRSDRISDPLPSRALRIFEILVVVAAAWLLSYIALARAGLA